MTVSTQAPPVPLPVAEPFVGGGGFAPPIVGGGFGGFGSGGFGGGFGFGDGGGGSIVQLTSGN